MRVANSGNAVLWILRRLLVGSEWVSIPEIVKFIQDEIHGKGVDLYRARNPQGIRRSVASDLSSLRGSKLVETNDGSGWKLTGAGEVLAMGLTMPIWVQRRMAHSS